MPAMDYERIAWLYDSYAQQDFDFQFFIQETTNIAGDVLELTSGTGRLSIPLIEAGVRLTCVDSSEAMIDVCRRKLYRRGLEAELHCQDIAQLALDGLYECIILPFHSFSEITDAGQQRLVLQRVREHLVPGGRFICTMHNPPVRLRSVDGRQKLLGAFPVLDSDDRLFLWNVEQYDAETNSVSGYQFYEIYGPNGEMKSKLALDLRFALHTQDEFSAMAVQAGLNPVTVYGNYQYAPFDPESSPVIIWIGTAA